MWYPSGNYFISLGDKKVHKYVLRYAESRNGVDWPKEGLAVIRHANDDEYGFGRPYIVKQNGVFRLFYSIRTKSKGYRLGFAESVDGKSFDRRDSEIGIDVSLSGWDSEMQCYSSLLDVNNKSYLFYNGNGLGDVGFGYAEAV